MLRRAFESVFVLRARPEAADERIEIQVVPLPSWSRFMMKSCAARHVNMRAFYENDLEHLRVARDAPRMGGSYLEERGEVATGYLT